MTTWQYQYRDLTFGEGTSIDVVLTEGLEDLPRLRGSDVPRSGRHGMTPGLDLAEGRTVTFELDVFGADETEFRSLLESIKEATVPAEVEYPLTFQHPGQEAQRITARPRRRSTPQDVPFSLYAAKVFLEFAATDPRIYSDTLQSGITGFPEGGVGREYPLTFPRVYGAAGSGGSVSATNDGTTSTPWVATITGPWVNPTITNVATGDVLSLSISVGSGETLVLDSSDESVLLGSAHRLNTVLPGSVWPSIEPGSNELRFGGASGSGSALLEWRSAWL